MTLFFCAGVRRSLLRRASSSSFAAERLASRCERSIIIYSFLELKRKTVETVPGLLGVTVTGLKSGVNERGGLLRYCCLIVKRVS